MAAGRTSRAIAIFSSLRHHSSRAALLSINRDVENKDVAFVPLQRRNYSYSRRTTLMSSVQKRQFHSSGKLLWLLWEECSVLANTNA